MEIRRPESFPSPFHPNAGRPQGSQSAGAQQQILEEVPGQFQMARAHLEKELEAQVTLRLLVPFASS